MSMTDNIADMIVRIKNAQSSKFISLILPFSKMKCAVLKVLESEGYIKYYQILKDDNLYNIEVYLKYSYSGIPAICKIIKVSKPGKRIYSSINSLKEYYNGMGIYILSTSKGVLSNRDAYKQNVGGEVICKVF